MSPAYFSSTRKRIAWIIVGFVIATSLTLSAFNEFGVIGEPTLLLIMMWLLAAMGVTAGLIGATKRKQNDQEAAIFAYPVAVWCLFLAFWQAIPYPRPASTKGSTRSFARS